MPIELGRAFALFRPRGEGVGMKLLGFLIAFSFAGGASASVDCRHLRDDLAGLRQAQQAILVSLANNHENFAASFEEVSTEAQLNHMRIPSAFLEAMKKTAAAYRARGVAAKAQAEKLDRATGELIDEVMACVDRK